MRSMTGYGQATGENERYRFAVTLRSVNHRFLDVVSRGLDERRELEAAIRELLSSRLRRGRVEASFEITPVAPRQVVIGVEESLMRSLRALCDDLADRGWISRELVFGDLLRMPEALRVEVRDPDWSSADSELLLSVAGEALDRLLAARDREGEKLLGVLDERLSELSELAAELRQLHAGAVRSTAERLERRIAELLVGELPDESRMAQEVAILVDRSDVAEELDRLESHFDHLRSIFGQEGSIGKRLDFLAQEIFRELNTIGSKCRDSEMTQRVVESKVRCEQIREQVQNIE